MLRFSTLHPFVSAVYFLSVLLLTMFSQNLILHFMSLVGGLALYIKIKRNLKLKEFGYYFALFILAAITNPLFSHNGVTVLFFINNNPITLEAFLYGLDLGLMLLGVLFWFNCFNLVVTEDKLLFILGKLSPKIALLVSSALRFVPLLKRQSSKIKQTQKAMGLYSTETWLNKAKSVLRVFSALISWSLENSIETGMSMRARGYGINHRTNYSDFKFRLKDFVFLIFVVFGDLGIIIPMYFGVTDFSFYPALQSVSLNLLNCFGYLCYLLLCIAPFIIEVKESVQWKYYISKI